MTISLGWRVGPMSPQIVEQVTMNPGPWGLLIILVAILLLFGRGKISGLMGEVASGIKAFQRGIRDDSTASAQLDAKEPEHTKQV